MTCTKTNSVSLEPFEVSGFKIARAALEGVGKNEFDAAMTLWNQVTLQFPRLAHYTEWRDLDGYTLMIAPWRDPKFVRKSKEG